MMKLEWVWGLHFGANEEKEGQSRGMGIPYTTQFLDLSKFVHSAYGWYACIYLFQTLHLWCIFISVSSFIFFFWEVDESIYLYIRRVSIFL